MEVPSGPLIVLLMVTLPGTGPVTEDVILRALSPPDLVTLIVVRPPECHPTTVRPSLLAQNSTVIDVDV